MTCIDPWLLENQLKCALCRQKVFASDSEDDTEDERTPLLASPRTRRLPVRSGGSVVDTMEEGDDQLLTEVIVEQARTQRADSLTSIHVILEIPEGGSYQSS